MQEKVCAYCHKVYYIKDNARKRLKYCSAACRRAGHAGCGFDTVCPICGKVFHNTPSVNRKYCSQACYNKAQSTPEHIAFRKEKLVERWGVDEVSKIPGVKEKRKQTTLKHFGVEYSMQSKVVQAKSRETCLRKYNTEYPAQSSSVKEKARKTCQERYGCDSVLGSAELRKQWSDSLFKREGIRYTVQRQLSPQAREAFATSSSLEAFILKHKCRHAPLMYNELGVDDTTFYSYLDKYNLRHLVTHSDSQYEHTLRDLFPTITFIKDRTILEGKEIDLYAPDHKIGIEFNGSFWHSDYQKDKEYHRRKSALALDKGVFLFHIFEYEWEQPRIRKAIINRLNNLFKLNTKSIYARKCTVTFVSASDARSFYNENHVQGMCPANVHLGLKDADTLVALMSFKTNGINKAYQWELCRFCSKAGTNVVGGASKLFKHFVRTYNPDSIVSYSDIAKTRGTLYETLGFNCIKVAHPQYHWVLNGKNVLTRYQCQLKQLIKKGWKAPDDGLTEDQVMRSHGYKKLYDCGKKVWVYSK